MSDPGGLLLVRRGDGATSERRWRRRGRDVRGGPAQPDLPSASCPRAVPGSPRPRCASGGPGRSRPEGLPGTGGTASTSEETRRGLRVSPTSAPPAVRRHGRVFVMRTALGAALLAGAAWASLALAVAHAGDSAFSRRIGAGCEELEPCQTLEAEAEQRVDECSFACGRAAAEYRAARLMRFRAEERRAVRDHYRERDRAEQLERQSQRTRSIDDWQRREAARAEEAERDRRHQVELERLRQAHVDRRLADERERRQRYYAALGPEGRAMRLERCLAGNERCDALVIDLLDATRDDAERRKLAERNEGVTHPAPTATSRATAHGARDRRARSEALPTTPTGPASPEPDSAPATPSS
jgi:hypothetical protein